MPFDIFIACSDGETINVQTLRELKTTTDYDGLLDILELKEVHDSWVDAETENARLEAGK